MGRKQSGKVSGCNHGIQSEMDTHATSKKVKSQFRINIVVCDLSLPDIVPGLSFSIHND